MIDAAAPTRSPDPRPEDAHKRPWPTTAVSLLLAGQAVGYLVLNVWHGFTVAAETEEAVSLQQALAGVFKTVAFSVTLFVLVVLALFAIVTIRRRWASAWLNALVVQTVGLGLALVLYFTSRPFYAYVIMAYALYVVVYLILPGVQAAFLPPPAPGKGLDEQP